MKREMSPFDDQAGPGGEDGWDAGMRATDELAGAALRTAAGIDDAGRMGGLTMRLLEASTAHAGERVPALRLRGADESGEGPNMLPAAGRQSRWYFIALAACLVLAVSLALRFSIQMIPANPRIDSPLAQREKNETTAWEFSELSQALSQDVFASLTDESGAGSWNAWALDATALSADIQSAYAGLASDEDHDLIEQAIADMDAGIAGFGDDADDTDGGADAGDSSGL